MKLKKQDIISVADSSGKKSQEKWQITDVTGARVIAIPVDGDEKNKRTFHCSRVMECNGKDTGALETAEKQTNINSKFKAVKETKSAKKIEDKTTKTTTKNPIKLDLNALTSDGSELYAKTVDGFNHNVIVMSYCLIAADKKSYKYFNLYDGSLGKNGGNSISKKGYPIKDRKNGYKKLLNSLKKKQYSKI